MADPATGPRTCDAALTRAFDVLGKRWNGLLLGVLGDGPATFGELRRVLSSISDSMLSDRLTELAAAGLVERSVEPGPPVTVSYALTADGTALIPALEKLRDWAGTSLAARS